MRVTIKMVPRLPDGDAGIFTVHSRNRATIRVSLERNPRLFEFAATLLHELLHLWVEVLLRHGFKIGARREHQWIEACEGAIARLLKAFHLQDRAL